MRLRVAHFGTPVLQEQAHDRAIPSSEARNAPHRLPTELVWRPTANQLIAAVSPVRKLPADQQVGSAGLATTAERDEQRKMVKYNHLVANLLIFHTAVGMTRALEQIAASGHAGAITPEALAGTSPYLNEHLNRFGSYELDLSKPPAPLPFELPDRLRPSPAGAAAAPV